MHCNFDGHRYTFASSQLNLQSRWRETMHCVQGGDSDSKYADKVQGHAVTWLSELIAIVCHMDPEKTPMCILCKKLSNPHGIR